MRDSVTRKRLACVAAAVAAGLGTSAATAATLELRLTAPNYDPGTGTWTDTSGLGNHATVLRAGGEPTLAAGSTPTGQSAVRFDGNDDGFSLPNFLSGDSAAEVFIVLRADADPPGADQSGLWNFGSTGDNSHYPWTDGVVYDEFGTGGRKTSGNPAPALTQYNIYNVRSEPGLWQSRFNNNVHYTDNANVVGFATNPKLGESESESYNFDGDIAEIRIYSYGGGSGNGLTEDERTAVFNELNNQYLVPEPATLGLVGVGGLALLARRRRQ